MPLRDDLLTPIAGENPSGANLKYDRVYDQIKEARSEDDDTLPTGAWGRTAKRADSNLVMKLAGETLATRSKDLQLAAWLGEAHIRKEGVALVKPVLQLFLELQKAFWETIYPEIDEGDVGLRAMPLEWAAKRYSTLVYEFPITKGGINFFTYKSGRAIGYAADGEENESRREARELAIARGQSTAEDVDEAIAQTSKSFYANLDPVLGDARETLEELSLYCEEQYGDDGPSFRKLRDSLEEVQNLVHSLLAEKRVADPDAVVDLPQTEPEPEPEAEPEAEPSAMADEPAPSSAKTARRVARSSSGQPESLEDAADRVHACALYMSTEAIGSPVPYLLHTSLWWAPLRESAPSAPSLDLMPSPSSEHRTALKSAVSDGDWSAVLATAMQAMAEPGARCWLDIHRSLWRASTEQGYSLLAAAIVAAVHGLLQDLPEMPEWTFADDTPVANAETLRWLEEHVKPARRSAPVFAASAANHEPAPRVASRTDEEPETGAAPPPPDVYVVASQLARAGQLGAATAMLTRDAAIQTSGRMRSQRRVEIAELCLSAGSSPVAASILREVVAEMEQRRLDTWETKETVARPLALLLRCTTSEAQTPDWEARFARLCALDPGAALDITI